MKFYIIYQYYTKLIQFKGEWVVRYAYFHSYKKAMEWIVWTKTYNNIRDVIGPLTKSKPVK
jgi:hypothetical protein